MLQTVLTLGTGSVARAFPAVLKFECGPRAVEGRPRAGRVHYFISQGILKRGRNGAVPNQLSLFLSLSLSLASARPSPLASILSATRGRP